MSFLSNLQYGQDAEKTLMEFFRTNGYTATSTSDKGVYSDYDIALIRENGEITTFEVKRDTMARSTGNIAIEISKFKNGKEEPSGLSATKADYYVYKIDGIKGYWALPVSKLLQMVKYNHKCKIRGGDRNCSNLVLIDRDLYMNNAVDLIQKYGGDNAPINFSTPQNI